MSAMANKRALAAATHSLVHASRPDLPQIEAVGKALAQVFTDVMGVNCQLVFKVDRAALTARIAEAEANQENQHG